MDDRYNKTRNTDNQHTLTPHQQRIMDSLNDPCRGLDDIVKSKQKQHQSIINTEKNTKDTATNVSKVWKKIIETNEKLDSLESKLAKVEKNTRGALRNAIIAALVGVVVGVILTTAVTWVIDLNKPEYVTREDIQELVKTVSDQS